MADGGLIYEPRALWSIANVVGSSDPQLLQVDRRHLFNGERWPITITRVSLAAINYTLAGTPPPASTADLDTSTIISRARVSLSVPLRYHFNRRQPIVVAGFGPERTAQPPTANTAIAGPYGTLTYRPSSLFGLSHLRFDKPLMLPKNGTIEWGLSAHTSPLPTPVTTNPPVSYASMLYQESGGFFGGSGRSRDVQLFCYSGQALPGIECWPYSPDTFGGGAMPAVVSSNNWWPPQSLFPAGGNAPDFFGQRNTTFSAQESTRSGSTELSGMSCFFFQVQEDVLVSKDPGGTAPSVPPSELCTRTGCRVRSTNAGSAGHDWWRPGAPVCLVMDTITPANVIELSEPITLGPGEQLDAEIEVPANLADQQTTFRIGVSFNGYAAIEG